MIQPNWFSWSNIASIGLVGQISQLNILTWSSLRLLRKTFIQMYTDGVMKFTDI